MTLLVSIVSAVATLTGFLLFLGPSPSIRTIYQTRSTGVTPLVPLVAMCTSGWVWSIYGLLHNDIFPLMTTNAIGVFLTAIYISVFYWFTHDKPYAHKVFAGFGSAVLLVTVYAILGHLGYTGQSHEAVTNVMGYIGNVVVFIFFAAPFENVRQVFRHRSGVFLPIMIVLANLLNASVWLTYGLLVSDILIIVPNVGALVIGSVQVAVYLYFHPSTHPYYPPVVVDDGALVPKDLEAASASVTSPSFVALQSPRVPVPVRV